jgi:hypothetical protein
MLMTVREFIDQIVAQARKGWRHLTPVFETWGDGATTACAVTAIASECEEYALTFSGDESRWVPWAERMVATVAMDAGMTVEEAYTFSKKIVDCIPDAYDNDVIPSPLRGSLDILEYVGGPVGALGVFIGHELRRVAECVLKTRTSCGKSASKDAAKTVNGDCQPLPTICTRAERDEPIYA